MFTPGVRIKLKNELNLRTNIGFRVREIVQDTVGTLIESYSTRLQPDCWVVDFGGDQVYYPVCEVDMVLVSIFKESDYEVVK